LAPRFSDPKDGLLWAVGVFCGNEMEWEAWVSR
jgi:hypothetical protein